MQPSPIILPPEIDPYDNAPEKDIQRNRDHRFIFPPTGHLPQDPNCFCGKLAYRYSSRNGDMYCCGGTSMRSDFRCGLHIHVCFYQDLRKINNNISYAAFLNYLRYAFLQCPQMALSLYALYSLPDLPVPAMHAFPTTPVCACLEPENIIYSHKVKAWVLVCPNKTISDPERGCKKRMLYGNYRAITPPKWRFSHPPHWQETRIVDTIKYNQVPVTFAQTRANDTALFSPSSTYTLPQGLQVPIPPPRWRLVSHLNSLNSQRAEIRAERIETRAELERLLIVARENYAGDGKCMTCLLHDRNALCLPCKHLNQCITCAPKLKKCPACRQHVEKLMRVYDVDK